MNDITTSDIFEDMTEVVFVMTSASEKVYPRSYKKAHMAPHPKKRSCKCQYKNVGFLENKNVGFPTRLFSNFF